MIKTIYKMNMALAVFLLIPLITANAIGADNTRKPDDNTDWVAIHQAIDAMDDDDALTLADDNTGIEA